MMERVRRLQQLWNWLPAFRAVAETEHLPTAAERLFVTPPALSRSIRQLEDDLGRPLFDRVGRRIRLNAEGRVLLGAVRDAMRRLDDAIGTVTGQALAGPLRIAAPMPFLSLLVLPVCRRLSAEHPDLIPHLSSVDAEAGNRLLLAGQLDLLLVDDPVPHSKLVLERLTDLRYGVYCGVTHPLAGTRTLTHADLRPHMFAAPPGGLDHWPPGLERTVGMVLSHLQIGVEVCAEGRYLTVLPDLIANHHPASDRLHRLDFDFRGDTALYAARRTQLVDGGVVELTLGMLGDVLKDGSGKPAPAPADPA